MPATQRLDKWLWFTRLVKTRSQAGRMIEAGKVRVNRVRTTKPASQVRPTDVVTAIISRQPRVIKVLEPGKRRGPAPEAQMLYEDLTPKASATQKKNELLLNPTPPQRDPGAGRPTKRERRKMDNFRELARSERGSERSRKRT